MPSPESPAKRTTTRSRSSIVLLMASRPFDCALPAYEVYAGPSGRSSHTASERAPHTASPASPRRRRPSGSPLLQLHDVDRLGALGALLLVERDPAAFGERAVAICIDAGVMDEQISPTVVG